MNLARASQGKRGSVLVITVVFCGLVGIVLVAYLSMVSSQHSFSHRSQVWNDCIPLCEAGIEEAMSHLNFSGTTSNFAVNGWVLSHGSYRKERTLNGGRMQMAISTENPPVITVRGSLLAPLQSNHIARVLQAQTKNNKRFAHGILAKGKVTLSGNAARVDSFNATNMLESTGGQYDPLKATDRAIVATTSQTPGNFDIGNVSIYGYAATGVGGNILTGPNGNVGSMLWNDNPLNNGRIEPSHYTDDANMYIPDAALPTYFAATPPQQNVTINGTNYTWVFGDGDYRVNTINLSSSDKILITGNARVHVTGDTSVSGQAFILIANNASVEWYSGGNMNLSGGGVVNAPGLAKNFSVYGLPTCTAIDYSGSSQFIGTIYAPQADVKLVGNNDSSGAFVGKTVNISGGMSFHYDESLQAGPASRYLISSWREL